MLGDKAMEFANPVTNYAGLQNVGYLATPTLGDLDNDGDLDALIGECDGKTYYFENKGTAQTPQFANPVTNYAGLQDVGDYSTPTLGDLDNDGDLDVLIGESNGNTYYFENITAVNSPPTAINLSNNEIAENEPVGTTVGTLTTTDPDTGDSFTYTLLSGSEYFTIDGDLLKTLVEFDYEAQSSYSVEIETDDGNGGTFSDTLTISVGDVEEVNNIIGTNGNDKLRGTNGPDYIEGGAGNDTIWSKGGDDTLDGGDGNDKIYGNTGNGLIYGGDGNDTIIASRGDDEIYGDGGDDLLKAGGGNDTLTGGSGSDTMVGGAGSDVFVLENTGTSDVDLIKDFRPKQDKFMLPEGLSFSDLSFGSLEGGQRGTSITFGVEETPIATVLSVNPNILNNSNLFIS
jgi:Ca2+-binding RTX toxin-like protein